jgi:uncharacterized membrane protein YgcG
MMLMNENQRVKEDMLHTNAVMNRMQMQLHWVMSATLHQRTSTSGGSSSGRAGGSTSASGGSASGTQGASSSLGTRPGASATLHGPIRRLSDSTRQDTKL